MGFHTLNTDDFHEDLREDFEHINSFLTRKVDGRKYSDQDGIVLSNVRQSDDDSLVEIAEKIVSLTFDVLRH